MRTTPPLAKRKIGVHVSLDLDTLGRLDDAAEQVGISRSQLLRRMIEAWTEDEEAAAWVAREGAASLGDDRVPWDEAKAELGL